MGLYGMMRTSASGMAAQANRSRPSPTTSPTPAPPATSGRPRNSPRSSCRSGQSEYISGSVDTNVRYAISEQGSLRFTTSSTDLGVKGNGFFVVSNDAGQTFLTRAGSFVPDGDGNLVNAAGFKLMGYPPSAETPISSPTALRGSRRSASARLSLQACPVRAGNLAVNLPVQRAVVAAANLPAGNAAGRPVLGQDLARCLRQSRQRGDARRLLGQDRRQHLAGHGFRPRDGGGRRRLSPTRRGRSPRATLTFDATTGDLAAASPTSLNVPIPNGSTVALDLSQTSQLATDYTVFKASMDGNAPSKVDHVEISDDGQLFSVFENGARWRQLSHSAGRRAEPRQPAAARRQRLRGEQRVRRHPDRLSPRTADLETMVSGALEQSTVDLASELTNMIESERNYTANSKVFQTGADLMDVLVNLKR